MVVVDGECSDSTFVNAGVIKGCVLLPALFLLYIKLLTAFIVMRMKAPAMSFTPAAPIFLGKTSFRVESNFFEKALRLGWISFSPV